MVGPRAETFDDFHAVVVGRPGFESCQLRVLTDPEGVIVGVSSVSLAVAEDGRGPEAFISRLAVCRDQRNRGHAQALMVDSFAQGRAHGAATSALSTDSRTGALGLYEKVGMRGTSVWVHRAITL